MSVNQIYHGHMLDHDGPSTAYPAAICGVGRTAPDTRLPSATQSFFVIGLLISGCHRAWQPPTTDGHCQWSGASKTRCHDASKPADPYCITNRKGEEGFFRTWRRHGGMRFALKTEKGPGGEPGPNIAITDRPDLWSSLMVGTTNSTTSRRLRPRARRGLLAQSASWVSWVLLALSALSAPQESRQGFDPFPARRCRP